MNGAHRPELDGAHDISLRCTPFTFSLPIRRLPILPGDAAELTVLEVDVETLAVTPVPVVLERSDVRTWRARLGDGTTEFEVDEHGVPLDVEGAFRRVG
jgi:hypothetical protein